MSGFKVSPKKRILFDIFLIVLVNAVFFFTDGEKWLVQYVRQYQLEAFIPFAFIALLSVLYYLLRRWFDSLKLCLSMEKRIAKDTLTQLYSRRTLEVKLLQEWQHFRRFQQSFCLIMLHIDDFKDINEHFGHQEGDRVIIEVSEKLLNNTRKTDFCARWSGTEFLILCPGSELSAIEALAERLRADVYCLLTGGIELSLSLGVSQASDNDALDELVKKVELQLYKARKSGGNCVISG